MAKLFEIGTVEYLNDINTKMVLMNIDHEIQQSRNVTERQSAARGRITRSWPPVTADLWAGVFFTSLGPRFF